MHYNDEELTPGNMDIVCGRGKSFDDLPGNQLFRKFVQRNAAIYASPQTTRSEKSILIRTVRELLNKNSISFIKRNDINEWVGMEEKEIKIKIGHALRDVEAVRRKKESSRQKRMAKRKRWNQTRISNKNLDVSHDMAATNSPIYDASSEPRPEESSVPATVTPNASRLEESIYSIDAFQKPKLELQTLSRVKPNKTGQVSSKGGDTKHFNTQTIPQLSPPIHIDYTTDIGHTEFGGSIPDDSPASPFPLLDTSLLFLACEVPITSSLSSSSVTSDDWFYDAAEDNISYATH